jgi:hypothetical protein
VSTTFHRHNDTTMFRRTAVSLSDSSPYPVWREETGQKLGSPEEAVADCLLELECHPDR